MDPGKKAKARRNFQDEGQSHCPALPRAVPFTLNGARSRFSISGNPGVGGGHRLQEAILESWLLPFPFPGSAFPLSAPEHPCQACVYRDSELTFEVHGIAEGLQKSLAAPSEVAQGGLGRGEAAVPVPAGH